MAKTRKTAKAIEIHEVYIIRSASGALPAFCAACATGDALLVAPEQAAALAQVPVRTIYRWVETATVHYKEGPNGSLTVCLKSLPAASEQIREDLLK